MKKELTRRDLMGRAGLLLGGAMTLGALQACGDEDSSPVQSTDTAAKLKDFPYEKHLPDGFQLDKAVVQEAAYHGYYDGGGCGHGSWSGLLTDLVRAGEPFSQLPMNYGVFGGGGVALYGSICGAALSGVLVINSLVAHAGSRSALMTELLRWYETHEFPAYQPQTVNAAEVNARGTAATSLQLNWGAEAEKPAVTKVAPGSHLCHASVSGWCAAQSPIVNAGSANQPDKKARCARLTADVAGKVADILNAYLASGALGARSFAATGAGSDVTGCTSCHDVTVKAHNGLSAPPAATGMSCPTCHTDKVAEHQALASCTTCHGAQ